MALSHQILNEVADSLREATQKRTPVSPPSKQYPEMTVDDAYSIQWINEAHAVKSGRRALGYKIGLTSREAQKHFGVYEPDFGHLFDSMWLAEEAVVDLSTMIQPKIEGEITFVLGRDLEGPGVTVVDALRSVDYVMCSMEIIDSRIKDWKITASDTIADNGSSGYFILAGKKMSLSNLSLPDLGMALSRNGDVMCTGSGAAVLGNPLSSVVFLANELGKHNRSLKAGDVILSGALSGVLPLKVGDYFTCEIAELGKVSIRVG
jgi:2-keto-4-pentenoate hydratase